MLEYVGTLAHMEDRKKIEDPWGIAKNNIRGEEQESQEIAPESSDAQNPVIGGLNTFRVIKQLDFGVYLDAKELGEILMPREYVPEGCALGDMLEVFLSLDSEDRLVATNIKPYAMAGELAYLKVVAVNDTGAFLDWGLPKDLLVPYREQRIKMVTGKSYLVFVYLDTASKRLAASSKIHKFIVGRHQDVRVGEEVSLVVAGAFGIGYNVIINNHCLGVVYKSEVFRELKDGQHVAGFIKKIREDAKIDVALQRSSSGNTDALQEDILQRIKDGGGILDITDKSSPDLIYRIFKVSKKSFKRAIGVLYKQRRINISTEGLRLP